MLTASEVVFNAQFVEVVVKLIGDTNMFTEELRISCKTFEYVSPVISGDLNPLLPTIKPNIQVNSKPIAINSKKCTWRPNQLFPTLKLKN